MSSTVSQADSAVRSPDLRHAADAGAAQRSRLSNFSVLLFLAFLLCLLNIPIWVFEYPPLVDYPNHLARMYIILNQDQPVLRDIYEISWSFVPNLAMDVFVPPVAKLFGVAAAGRIFVSTSIVLLTSSSLFLSYLLFGRISPVALAGSLFIYNNSLALGYLNYLFGCGLAIWFFCLYLMLIRKYRYVPVLLGTVMATIVMVAHLSAFGIYAILVGGYAATRQWPPRLVDLARHGAQFVLPIALFLATSETASGDAAIVYPSLLWKLRSLSNLSMFKGLDLILIGLVVLGLAAWMVWRRCWILHRSLTAPVLCLLVLYCLIPEGALTAHHADWRLPIPAAFLVCGALINPLPGRSAEETFVLAVLALCALQLNFVVDRWRQADRIQQQLIATLQALPPGAKIFPIFRGGRWRDAVAPMPLVHLASFGVMANAQFIPSLFAYRTSQPLRYQGEYDALRATTDKVVYLDHEPVDWDTVRQRFDYIVLMTQRDDAEDWKDRIPVPARTQAAIPPHVLVLAIERPAEQGAND